MMIVFLLMDPPSLSHLNMIVKPGHALNTLAVVAMDERKLQLLQTIKGGGAWAQI